MNCMNSGIQFRNANSIIKLTNLVHQCLNLCNGGIGFYLRQSSRIALRLKSHIIWIPSVQNDMQIWFFRGLKLLRHSANTTVVGRLTHLIQVAELRLALGIQNLHLEKNIILILRGTCCQAMVTPGLYELGYGEKIS